MQLTNDCAGHRSVYCYDATKTIILEMCNFTIIRTISVPTVNSTKFLLRVDISMSSLALFFLTSLAIFGKIERFSSRLSRFPTKKLEIFSSQTEAHPGFGKGSEAGEGHNGGGTTEGVGAKGVGFHIKKYSF